MKPSFATPLIISTSVFEVLEILKKWIVVDETYDDLFPYEIKLRNGYVSNKSCLVFTKDDYEKVKEWLENDN